jgi:ditrans,polycis-polyprenyl diphosphate synthase
MTYLVNTCLQGCPAVDLLIRTSGESRLSDFMLWQVSLAHIVFADVLWPEFSFLDLLRALVQYQLAFPVLQKTTVSVNKHKCN